MANSEEIAGEVAAAVREVFGPSIWEEAVAQALADRVLQRLEAKGLRITDVSAPAGAPWVPDYR